MSTWSSWHSNTSTRSVAYFSQLLLIWYLCYLCLFCKNDVASCSVILLVFAYFQEEWARGPGHSFLGLQKTLLNISPFIPLKDVKNTCFGPEITFYLLLWRINEYILSVPKLLLNYVACEGSESYGNFLALKTCSRAEMTRLTLCHQSMQNWLVFGQHQNLTSFDVIWCHLTSLLIWWWVSAPIFAKFGRQELLKDQFVTWSEMHE